MIQPSRDMSAATMVISAIIAQMAQKSIPSLTFAGYGRLDVRPPDIDVRSRQVVERARSGNRARHDNAFLRPAVR